MRGRSSSPQPGIEIPGYRRCPLRVQTRTLLQGPGGTTEGSPGFQSRATERQALGLRGFALATLALLALACGGGGSGGGGPTEPTPTPTPAPGIVFSPSGSPGASAIFLAGGVGTTANTLFLEVRANQATDLYGVAFDLTYPSAQLQFVRATAGPFLGANGSVQAVVSNPGTLVVGATHLGAVPGANGSGVLLTLEFSAVANGQGSFAYSRNSAFSSTGQTLIGTSWLAGSVQVTR
jgi:Cohesin domain